MVITLKQDSSPAERQALINRLQAEGIVVQTISEAAQFVLALSGDTAHLDPECIAALPFVDDVKRIGEPYILASRKVHPESTVIPVGSTVIGGGNLTLIAGPCSVESQEQILAIAESVKQSGATILRGGAFKPRTSPYTFQGLEEEGLRLLKLARKKSGLAVVTEIMDAAQLPLFDDIDIIQVGARNMQNYSLLKALSKADKPILLKRGISATYEEWLMSAEYLMTRGNNRIILCERGIRTFEPYTRNTLDLSAVPVLHRLTHLPVIVDPSHAGGKAYLVEPLALGAVAAGADGIMTEVHNDPAHALSDGVQSISTQEFTALSRKLTLLHREVSALSAL